ncbi:MAG: DUF1491 family protein [Novosphingobium sp.]
MEARLPAHIEVSGLIRRTQAEGGFATVLRKGDPDAGTLLIVLTDGGRHGRAFERMPMPDGSRGWLCAKTQNAEDPSEFESYLERRKRQDSDLWLVELDLAGGERLLGLEPKSADI